MRTAAVFGLVFLILQPAFGQAPPGAGESIEIMLVEVPVTVIDRNGEPVRSLTAVNFELFDEGQKRTINHFEVIDFSGTAQSKESAAVRSSARRNFLILFDLGHTDPGNLARARDAAAFFVKNQLVTGDRVAIGTISPQQGFRLLSSFTTDRTLTSLAIETLGVPEYYQQKDPLLLTATEFERLAGYSGTGDRGERIAEHYRHLATQQRRTGNAEQVQTISRELGRFIELGRLLDRVRGRKQIILLSEGFDSKMLMGRERLNTEEARREQTALEYGEIWNVDTDARFGNTGTQSTLGQMVDAFRRSDVVMNAIDVKGLRVDVDASEGAQRISHESLSLMTRGTGGEVFENSNDLSSNFSKMMKRQEVTYVLGFEVPTKFPGKFHELKVRLINTPGARVTHRPGYYEAGGSSSTLASVLTAGEIIMNQLPAEDVKVQVLTTPFPRPDGKNVVPVILEIEGKSLLQTKDNNLAAEILIYAFDKKEMIRDFVFQRVSFDLAKLRDRLAGKGVKFYHTLRLGPGDYSVRALVRTAGGQNGFRASSLHIPLARESYVAAPLLVDDTSGWVMVKAPDRAGAGPYPFTFGQETFVPAAAPRLSADGTYNVALVTYNLVIDNLSVQAVAADPSGVKHPVGLSLLGKTKPEADGRVTVVLQVKPAQLTSGRYALTFDVTQKGNPATTVLLPIEVQ